MNAQRFNAFNGLPLQRFNMKTPLFADSVNTNAGQRFYSVRRP